MCILTTSGPSELPRQLSTLPALRPPKRNSREFQIEGYIKSYGFSMLGPHGEPKDSLDQHTRTQTPIFWSIYPEFSPTEVPDRGDIPVSWKGR